MLIVYKSLGFIGELWAAEISVSVLNIMMGFKTRRE